MTKFIWLSYAVAEYGLDLVNLVDGFDGSDQCLKVPGGRIWTERRGG